jgi:hypothetical protein
VYPLSLSAFVFDGFNFRGFLLFLRLFLPLRLLYEASEIPRGMFNPNTDFSEFSLQVSSGVLIRFFSVH